MVESSPVDWSFARVVAKRVGGPGPQVGPDRARHAVAELRECAAEATPLVAARTGLRAPADPGSTVVVDRTGWVEANAVGFEAVLDPVIQRLHAKNDSPGRGVGSRIAGAEIGLALGFLSAKVLGQYELFTASPQHRPRLLLVAPNIVQLEDELEVVPRDFRLWVCLHEETHRVQFTAVPWLGPWLRSQITGYLETVDLGGEELAQRLKQVVAAVVGALRGLDVVSVLEQSMKPEERELLGRLTGVMSLLEGHADVMMDDVGPDVLPSVGTLRARMEQRRSKPSSRDAFVRRLMGMESKLAQYRDGAAFVRAVISTVGLDGFNQVWTSPETLPTKEELSNAQAWVARVGGDSA